jgi:colicin import membrane protein
VVPFWRAGAVRHSILAALLMAFATFAAWGAEGDADKDKPKAPKGPTAEEQKQHAEKQARFTADRLSVVESAITRYERLLADVTDAAAKKEIEEAVANLKTAKAGLESSINALKQGDMNEARRIGEDMRKTQAAVDVALMTVELRMKMAEFQQIAQKKAGTPEEAAAKKVVDLFNKRLQQERAKADLAKQSQETERELREAMMTARPKPQERPHDKGERPARAEERKEKAKPDKEKPQKPAADAKAVEPIE